MTTTCSRRCRTTTTCWSKWPITSSGYPGGFAGIEGVERNLRYNRLDDSSRTDYAELEVKHDFDANEGDLVCMKTGGIHKVTNETARMTLSLHTYGRHINHTNRSQFDLDTNERKEFVVRVE